MTQYATITQANTYLQDRLNTSAWDNASGVDQDKALKQATRAIDLLNYHGIKTGGDGQENQFPRNDDTEVPEDIINACIEEALVLLDGKDPELEYESLFIIDTQYANIKSKQKSDQVPYHITAGIMSITAWRLLSPYLRDPSSINLRRVN